MQKELIDFKPIALWRVFVNSFETQPKDGHGHHHHAFRFSRGITCNWQLWFQKKERKQLIQTSSTTSTTWPHTPTSNFVSSLFLPQRHRDHHLLPCDATQLLVALPQGVGRKVKPSSKATWWKSKQLKPESSWNRKGVKLRWYCNHPWRFRKTKNCMIL